MCPLANPEAAARKLMEPAKAVEPMQDGRIYIEKINEPFLYKLRGTPAQYKTGLERAIANGWLALHESGTYVKFTQAGVAPLVWARISRSLPVPYCETPRPARAPCRQAS